MFFVLTDKNILLYQIYSKIYHDMIIDGFAVILGTPFGAYLFRSLYEWDLLEGGGGGGVYLFLGFN